MIIDAGIQLLTALVSSTDEIINVLAKEIPTLISGLITGILNNTTLIMGAGVTLLKALVGDMPLIIAAVVDAVKDLIFDVVDWIKDGGVQEMIEAGKNLMRGIGEGIKDMGDWLWNTVKDAMGSLTNKVKDFFGIFSPSRLWSDEIGTMLGKGIGVGLDNEMSNVTKTAVKDADKLTKSLKNSLPTEISVPIGYDNAALQRDISNAAAPINRFTPYSQMVGSVANSQQIQNAQTPQNTEISAPVYLTITNFYNNTSDDIEQIGYQIAAAQERSRFALGLN
jgi:phage-related protein